MIFSNAVSGSYGWIAHTDSRRVGTCTAIRRCLNCLRRFRSGGPTFQTVRCSTARIEDDSVQTNKFFGQRFHIVDYRSDGLESQPTLADAYWRHNIDDISDKDKKVHPDKGAYSVLRTVNNRAPSGQLTAAIFTTQIDPIFENFRLPRTILNPSFVRKKN